MMDVREYLLCFFDEFAYSAEDAEVLLRAYDVISAKNAAKTLFFEALSAYEKDYRPVHFDSFSEAAAWYFHHKTSSNSLHI